MAFTLLLTIQQVEERIRWGVPFYKYHGKLAGFVAHKKYVCFDFGAGARVQITIVLLEPIFW